MCYAEPEEYSEVWDERTVQARRVYTCTLCGMRICKGLHHVRISELYDGRWTNTRVHSDCMELSKFIQEEVCSQTSFVLMPNDQRELVTEHLEHVEFGREVWSMYRRVVRARMREGVWVRGGGVA